MAARSAVADLPIKTGLRPSRQAVKRAALGLALALGVAAAVDFGYGYFTTVRYLETTDDAYIGGDVTVMAPKVNGFVTDVLVKDNEHVHMNQVLVRLDARDYDARLAQAAAEVESARPACPKPVPRRSMNAVP